MIFSVTDIVFVAADAHEAFRADNTAEEIMKYVLSPEVQPVENFNCFEGMNISQSMISNNIFSGFQSPFAGIKGHMSTHISDNTVGPCRVVLQGTHFIDCYIHDNYFFGAPVNVEGHMELPLFTTGIGPNLTMINNNYLENFYFCKPASDTYGVTYTNNTFDHVYGIEFYTAGDATNAVSNCLFTDNTYGDIAAYFESFGYEPYSAGNKGENAYVIHAGSYNQRETDFNQMTAGNRSYIISCAGGTAITQCKFVEKDMSNTYLYHIANYSNQFRDKAISGTQVLDNAYEIDSFRKDDIFKDNTNLKDNGVSSEWQTKYFLSKKSSKEACIYYSPNGGVKIDLSCFYNPDSNETLGYAALGSVGAPDALIEENVNNQLYEDLKSGRNIVYLSDFGAYPDDFGNDSSAIQKAFDTIAETGDILIVEGTYTISTPILLRGDKTYRVLGNGGAKAQNNKLVGGGFTLDVYSEQLAKTGAFVQGAKDTGKVSGYFMNINMYPNNIGQIEEAKYSGTCFYQVRFEHMQIKNLNAGYLDSVYKECTFEQCILEGGFVLYYSHGFMNRCIFTESVLQHIYATGSVQNYGIGCTYAYFLVDTDFVYSTMRTCWIEFMQFTNGFRFNGNGNSLYVGNVFDYVWNFQFGENDIFAGNNLTHNGTISITNHFIQYDNIPREKWSSEIREGNITTMHISDGLRLVGNVFSDGNSQYTTYLNFDGRTSLYPYGDKIVTSISNVRIGGNITGFAKNANEMPQFLYSDTLLKENCVNNQIDLTSFAKSYKYIHDAQNYAYAKESCKNQLIPGTLVWLWNKEKENSSLFYYPSENNPVTLEPLPDKELEFDLTYDLPIEEKSKNTYSFDFVKDHLYLANEETTEVQGEIIGEYLKRIPFVSPLNETHLTPRMRNIITV